MSLRVIVLLEKGFIFVENITTDIQKRGVIPPTNKKLMTNKKPKEKEINKKEVGWICPSCGAGNAPWVARCNCNIKIEVKPPEWRKG